jgi:hypothetical protein
MTPEPAPQPLHGDPNVRTWDMVTEVSGPLEGELADWPSHIKEHVMAGVYVLEKKVGLPVKVTRSYCERDVDGSFYVHVIAQYVPVFVQVHQ